MEILPYKGQNVYTNSTNRVTPIDLETAEAGIGTILDTYFFQIGSDRIVEKVEFDKAKIQANQVGLMVKVKSQFGGQAVVSLAGLDRITQFLYDTKSLGKDLTTLKGRKITEYHSGLMLLGIGIKE